MQVKERKIQNASDRLYKTSEKCVRKAHFYRVPDKVTVAPTYLIVNNSDLDITHLLWLDALVNISVENLAIQKQFQSIISHFNSFSNVQDCEQYIGQKSEYDRNFLITSGRLGLEIGPYIHQLQQVFMIYVYCQDKKEMKHELKILSR